MNIVRPLVTAALVLTLGAATFAQSTTPDTTTTPSTTRQRGGGGGGRMREMMGQLNLTADQKAQIKQIRKSGTKGKERMKAILAVLTPEQKQKLMALRGSHGGGLRNRGGSSTSTPSTTTAPATSSEP